MMKATDTDPQRLDQDESSELGSLARGARSARPSKDTVGRMAANLARRGVFAGPSQVAPPPTVTPPSAMGSSSLYKLGALALVGIGGLLFVWQRTSVESSAPPVVVTVMAPISPPDPAPLPSPASAEPPSISVDALPSSLPSSPIASARSAAPRIERAPHASTPGPEVEFALVQRAQDALMADPARALVLVEEHAHNFPRGQFIQEREVVAVEALARLGKHTEARSRAQALVTSFPRTPYVPRLESALGEAIARPAPSKTAP